MKKLVLCAALVGTLAYINKNGLPVLGNLAQI